MEREEILNLIKELINKTGMVSGDFLVSEKGRENNQKGLWFSVEMENPHHFLRHEGEALLALNHLVRRILETKTSKPTDGQRILEPSITIDINGFQKKKIDNIRALAHMMAERARYFKSSIEVDPMPAYERRIVHEFLSDATDLKTESEGVGPSRRVVIRYIGGI